MKNKIKLIGTGNSGNFNYYIFEKKQKIVLELSKLFEKVFGLRLHLYDIVKDKEKEINYETKTDWHDVTSSDKARIDIYFGDKKMFVSIHCKHKLILEFNKKLFLLTYMPKPKKLSKK
ncbi:MAG: hypothetical protein KKF56_02625 [Nanoarchaeota archaeon]|nr:hypothetical protein [Nanoarchaeota archaeon]